MKDIRVVIPLIFAGLVLSATVIRSIRTGKSIGKFTVGGRKREDSPIFFWSLVVLYSVFAVLVFLYAIFHLL